MRSWNRTDKSLSETFSTWKYVLRGTLFDSLITQSVSPRLVTILEEVVVDPSNQHMSQINCVLKWRDAIGEILMSKLIDDIFFPKWIKVLRLWLDTKAYNDVGKWYLCWKAEFTGLQCNGFVRGLDIMNAHMSGVALKDTSFNHVKLDMNFKSLLLAKKVGVKLLSFKVFIFLIFVIAGND